MKIVVAGGAGFIGSNVVPMLTKDAGIREVVVVGHLSKGSLANLTELPVQTLIGSILDPSFLTTRSPARTASCTWPLYRPFQDLLTIRCEAIMSTPLAR